jgi:PIN domain nuclease of toxin-antitoxin system
VILLDTHVAIWVITSTQFGRRSMSIVKKALADGDAVVSAISFWEMAMLIAKRRLRSAKSATDQRAKILTSGIGEISLGGEICILAGELEHLHADPADRLIAATAIVHNAMLVTADDKLLRWRHTLRRQNAEA